LIVVGAAQAEERGEANEGERKGSTRFISHMLDRASDRERLREDAANTVFLAKIKVEELREKLHEAEDELARTRRSLQPSNHGTRLEIVRRPSNTQTKPQPKAEEAKPNTEAEEQADFLQAEVEIAELHHEVDRTTLQATMTAIRDAELRLEIGQDDVKADQKQIEAELERFRAKLKVDQQEFVDHAVELGAKKRELKKLRARIGKEG